MAEAETEETPLARRSIDDMTVRELRALGYQTGAIPTAARVSAQARPDTIGDIDISTARKEYTAEAKQQIEEQQAFNKRAQETLQRQREERKPDIEDLKRRQADLERVGGPPKMEAYPTPPNMSEMTKPTSMERTMGMASIFVLLSMGLTKGSGIHALNAFGGFLEGAHKGRVEQAEMSLKTFNAEMDRVWRSNDTALKEYSAVIGNKKLSFEMQQQVLKEKMLQNQDELSMLQFEQGGMNAVHQRMNDLAKMNNTWALEMYKYKQLERQIAHDRAMEAAKMKRENAAMKESDIAKIWDQATKVVEDTFPKDSLGKIIMSEAYGKSPEERQSKLETMITETARRIARMRGKEDYFLKSATAPADQTGARIASPGEDPASGLRLAISSGEIPKETRAAIDYLQRRYGVDAAKAAQIVQQVANETDY